jgi:cytochrome P450
MTSIAPELQNPAREMRHCALFDRKIVYENPYETIIPAIHEGPAVFYADNVTLNRPGWVVRRSEDLRRIFSDGENYHKRGNTGFARMIGEDWDIIPTELDPPVHTAYRAALNPLYAPSQMIKLDGKVRERARDLIATFKDKGECEFVQDFAILFPITIFLEMIDLPLERLGQFLEWENQLIRGTDQDVQSASVRAVKELLMETIAQRRKNPGDDLISKTMALEIDGRKWNDMEVFGHCFNLYIGGLDTVTANLGLHFRHLADNPHDQQTMRENSPAQNVIAVEELLRAYAVTSNIRIVSKEHQIGGHTLLPGDVVSVSSALAGRDPEAYDNPQDIRLDRKPTHVTLGHGIHRCLGQHLARRELQTAIEEFVKVIPTFSIQEGYRVPYNLGNVLGVTELPLRWG